MAKKQKHRHSEWIGAIVTLPFSATQDGVPVHPEMVVWMLPDGRILGSEISAPGTVLAKACESLRETMAAPMVSPVSLPGRVRVASADLASELSGAFPNLEILVGPTPEVDRLLAAMAEDMLQPQNGLLHALKDGIPDAAIASLFDAACGLFKARPWAVFPSDGDVLGITIEALDLHDGVISVIGQLGEQFGWVFFADVETYEAQLTAVGALERGEEASPPEQIGLTFDPRAEVPAVLVERAERAQWPVAADDAWPNLLAVGGEATTMRAVSAREIAIAEAITRVLTRVAQDPAALLAAQRQREPGSWSLPVVMDGQAVDVRLRTPLAERLAPLRPPRNLLEAMLAIEDLDDDAAREELWVLQDELLQGFWASPEAEDLPPDGNWCDFILSFALDNVGEMLPRMGPGHLDEVLFDVMPRKASVAPDVAPEVIAELQALYRYLNRVGGLVNGGACLAFLDGDTVDRLQVALADTSVYGPAKQMVMDAVAAGLDLSDRRAVESWMLGQQGALASRQPPTSVSEQRRAKRAEADAKKRKRKSATKARKHKK